MPGNAKILSVPQDRLNINGKLKAVNGQGIFDVVLMSYGSIEDTYKLLQENGIQSIEDTDFSNKIFKFDTSLVKDDLALNKILTDNLIYATLHQQAIQGASFNDDFNNDFDNGFT